MDFLSLYFLYLYAPGVSNPAPDVYLSYEIMNQENYIFMHEMKVRDYECDLQGIVNNANYQHYMEHSRHEFLETLGVNFGKLHDDGIDAMVSKITIEYKLPLRSGDRFVIGINLQRQGPRIVFYQDIFRLPDMKCVMKAVVDTVCLINGRLGTCDELDQKLTFQE